MTVADFLRLFDAETVACEACGGGFDPDEHIAMVEVEKIEYECDCVPGGPQCCGDKRRVESRSGVCATVHARCAGEKDAVRERWKREGTRLTRLR